MMTSLLKLTFCVYLIVSVVRACMLWKRFTCTEPMQVWLVAHQLITLCLCMLHGLVHRIGEPDAGGLLPVRGNRCQRVVSLFVLIVLVPAFIVSDTVGLLWFLGYSEEKSACWPSDVVNDPQVVALVLFGGCFWGVIFVLFGLSLLCNGALFRARALNFAREQGRTGSQRNLIVPLQNLLQHCPEAQCDKDCTAYCSICQDNCREDQQMRTIVVCGHQFHSECLERWLRNRPVCPNCQQDVTTPVVV